MSVAQTIAVRIPPELRRRLRRAAKREMVTDSAVARWALSEFLDRHEPAQPAPAAQAQEGGQ